ncbi:hypothetical protein M8494_04650 [Serratia ureilytica]
MGGQAAIIKMRAWLRWGNRSSDKPGLWHFKRKRARKGNFAAAATARRVEGHREFYSLKVRFFRLPELNSAANYCLRRNNQDKARNEKQAQFVG